MTEQQRREQILQARQQTAQQRSAVPAMSDADAEQIASQQQSLTKDQMIAIAMLGKMVQNDIGGIKRNAIGDSLKVSDVDMSKVMPSGIMKASGIPVQQVQQQRAPQPPPALPLAPPPSDFQFVTSSVQQLQSVNQVVSDPNQLEFDLNKQARYEDIINAIDKLENKINILTDKINTLIDSNNKKKPKIANGT